VWRGLRVFYPQIVARLAAAADRLQTPAAPPG